MAVENEITTENEVTEESEALDLALGEAKKSAKKAKKAAKKAKASLHRIEELEQSMIDISESIKKQKKKINNKLEKYLVKKALDAEKKDKIKKDIENQQKSRS